MNYKSRRNNRMEQLKNESSRQYEYMEEMKKWVQKKSEELGRKLKIGRAHV